MPAAKPPGTLQRGDVLCALPGVELLQLDGTVFGLSPGGDLFGLEGIDVEGLRDVLARVDGTRTVGEIVDALASTYDADDVLALLEELDGAVLGAKPADESTDDLAHHGVAVVGNGELALEVRRSLEAAGFRDVRMVEPTSEADEGGELRASLQRVRLHPALAAHGHRSVSKQAVAARVEGRSLVVCALEGVAGQALLDVNAACLEAGVPALFVTVQSRTISVGPLSIPGRSACFACSRLSTVLRTHFESEGPGLLPFMSFSAYPADAPRWALARAAHEVAREAAAAMRGQPYPSRIGSLLHIDPYGETQTQTVRPVSTCPACRGHHRGAVLGADAPAPAPLFRPEASIVPDRTGGTRSVEPAAAHARAMSALQQLGVDLVCSRLPSSAPEALLALECPYFTVRQRARFSVDASIVWPAFDDNCFGKGTTDEQALCSVVFEWIERNMAGWRGDVDLVRAPYREVRDRAMDMPYLVAGLLPGLPLGHIREFEDSVPIDWVWGHCLKSGRPILLPAACVYLGPSFFRGSSLELTGKGSSGLSAGCTLGDATLQGLLEVVERDAHYVALRNGLPLPWIDLGSITDSGSRRIIDSMDRSGYEVRLRDITTEVGIPSIEAYVVRQGEYTHHFASGYGAHLDPEIAVRRALSEAGQMLFFDIAKGRDDPERSAASVFNVFMHRKQVLEPRGERRLLDELPRSIDEGTPIWEQVDRVVACIAAGVPAADVCVVDLSHPELEGIHVVRTLVSGMLDEARDIQIHVPARCRHVPLNQMYLGRAGH
jgi:bacteriocin biosynthesis cyclodehydratase domain-containing protein